MTCLFDSFYLFATMPYCVAYNCNNSEKYSVSLHIYKFPSDDKVRNIWIDKIRRKNWTPSQHSRLCSQYFTHDCFEEDIVAMSASSSNHL